MGGIIVTSVVDASLGATEARPVLSGRRREIPGPSVGPFRIDRNGPCAFPPLVPQAGYFAKVILTLWV